MKYLEKIATPLLVSLVVAALTSGIFMAYYSPDNSDFDKSIRAYLLKNPEILGEMQDIYDVRQATEQAAARKKTLSERADIIFSSKYQVEIGAKDAKYKVVEFFDYNCPYCQRAMYDMEKILEKNPDVKFIIKEWPVLGPDSLDAHNISIAFGKLMPEKYSEFHQMLLGLKGNKGGPTALQLALSLGADEEQMLEEMAKPYIRDTLAENNLIASELGITGTPSYVIGDKIVFGAVGFDQINSHIEDLRKNN